MTCNVGRVERVIRGIIGMMILGLYGALEPPWQYFTLIGLLPLGSALTGFCPLYARLGRNHSQPAGSQRTL